LKPPAAQRRRPAWSRLLVRVFEALIALARGVQEDAVALTIGGGLPAEDLDPPARDRS
jgi:hypothetical protein